MYFLPSDDVGDNIRKRRKKGREKSTTSLNTYLYVNYNKPKKAGISMVKKLRLQS